MDGETAEDEEAEVATDGDGDESRTPNGAVSRQNSMSRSQVAC